MAISGARSRKAWATPLTMLVAPGPRVDRQMPGLPVRSPQVAASMAPATSCFISRKRIWRWRAASISSTDSPPGWPTMKGVPASLNAVGEHFDGRGHMASPKFRWRRVIATGVRLVARPGLACAWICSYAFRAIAGTGRQTLHNLHARQKALLADPGAIA